MPGYSKGGFAVSVTDVLWEGTARTVREAIDAWQGEEQGTARAKAAEEIVGVAMAMVSVAQHLLMRKWDDLFSERIADVETMGDHLEEVAATTIRLAQQARELASLVEAEGYKVDQVPELLLGIAKLSEMKDRLAKHWPRFDPVRLEQGLAQAARGEFVDREEIYREFPELQNRGCP